MRSASELRVSRLNARSMASDPRGVWRGPRLSPGSAARDAGTRRILELSKGVAGVADERCNARGVFAAGRSFHSGGHIDAPGGEGADGFRDIVRMKPASGDESKLRCDFAEEVLGGPPIVTRASAAVTGGASRIDEEGVDGAVASSIARDGLDLRFHVVTEGQHGEDADFG